MKIRRNLSVPRGLKRLVGRERCDLLARSGGPVDDRIPTRWSGSGWEGSMSAGRR